MPAWTKPLVQLVREHMKKRATLLLLGLFTLAAAYGGYRTLAHARHLRHVENNLEICAARTSVIFQHFDHDLGNIYKTQRSVDEALSYIDGVYANLHIHEDGSVRFEDDAVFDYIKLCQDALREEKKLIRLVEEFEDAGDARPAVGRARPQDQDLAQRRREEAFDQTLIQRRKLRETLTALENEATRIAEILPAAILVDDETIRHVQREIEDLPAPRAK